MAAQHYFAAIDSLELKGINMTPVRKYLNYRIALIFLIAVSTVSVKATASITINAIDITAHALVVGSNPGQTTYSATAIPAGGVDINASAGNDVGGGASGSSNRLTQTISSGETEFELTMEHFRSGVASVSFFPSAGLNYQGGSNPPSITSIKFTISDSVSYTLAGAYTVDGVEDERGASNFYSRLFDSSTTYFLSDQGATATEDITYTLGTGVFSGSLNGVLLAGTYEWVFGAQIAATNSPQILSDGGATGNGFFSLTLSSGDPGVVPEATSFLIWGLLGLTFGWCGWKRRERQ